MPDEGAEEEEAEAEAEARRRSDVTHPSAEQGPPSSLLFQNTTAAISTEVLVLSCNSTSSGLPTSLLTCSLLNFLASALDDLSIAAEQHIAKQQHNCQRSKRLWLLGSICFLRFYVFRSCKPACLVDVELALSFMMSKCAVYGAVR